MADDNRKEYTVTIGGVEHSMLLTDEDAQRYGEDASPAKKAASAENKARGVSNKES